MKSSRHTFGLPGLTWSVGFTFALALATACGGDDTNVVPGAGGQGGKGGTSTTGGGGKGTATGGSGVGGTTTTGGSSTGGAGAGGATTGGGGGTTTGAGGTTTTTGGSAGTGGTGTGGTGTGGTGTGGGGKDGGGGTGGSPPDGGRDGEAGVPLTLATYLPAIVDAFCDRVGECCNLDSTRYDKAKCVNALSFSGPERVGQYIRQYSGTFPATLQLDPVQAAQCVSLQRNRGCTTEDGAEKRNLYAVCMTAVQGSVAQDGQCQTSQECRSNLYCALPADAGMGKCTPLAGLNAACDDASSNSDRCTYLGIHNATSLHCSAYATATGGTCVAGLPLASACHHDAECASEVCSSISRTCVNSQPYPGPAACMSFTKVDDAGGGG
jgi:hypothetical protein